MTIPTTFSGIVDKNVKKFEPKKTDDTEKITDGRRKKFENLLKKFENGEKAMTVTTAAKTKNRNQIPEQVQSPKFIRGGGVKKKMLLNVTTKVTPIKTPKSKKTSKRNFHLPQGFPQLKMKLVLIQHTIKLSSKLKFKSLLNHLFFKTLIIDHLYSRASTNQLWTAKYGRN